MVKGTVRWFSNAHGYGFITLDDSGRDLFAHYSVIMTTGYKTLEEGQRVSAEIEVGPKGEYATVI